MKKKPYFFVRDDDVAEITPQFKAYHKMIASLHVPVMYAVIPGKLKKETGDFLRKNADALSVLQHGWMHSNHGNDKKKYEFGIGRGYERQKQDIQSGLDVMKKEFSFKERIFVPPYHGFDAVTVQVLQELQFHAISVQESSQIIGGVVNMPAAIRFEIFDAGTVRKRNGEELLHDFEEYRQKLRVFGIYTHHNTLDAPDLERLKRFLQHIRNEVIFIKSLAEMTGI